MDEPVTIDFRAEPDWPRIMENNRPPRIERLREDLKRLEEAFGRAGKPTPARIALTMSAFRHIRNRIRVRINDRRKLAADAETWAMRRDNPRAEAVRPERVRDAQITITWGGSELYGVKSSRHRPVTDN